MLKEMGQTAFLKDYMVLEMSEEAVNYSHCILNCVPYCYKTQKMGKKVLEYVPEMLQSIYPLSVPDPRDV